MKRCGEVRRPDNAPTQKPASSNDFCTRFRYSEPASDFGKYGSHIQTIDPCAHIAINAHRSSRIALRPFSLTDSFRPHALEVLVAVRVDNVQIVTFRRYSKSPQIDACDVHPRDRKRPQMRRKPLRSTRTRVRTSLHPATWLKRLDEPPAEQAKRPVERRFRDLRGRTVDHIVTFGHARATETRFVSFWCHI